MVLNSYSAYHAQYNPNSSNPFPQLMSTQFYPTMNLSAINTQGFLPPSNQHSINQILFFTSMLLSQHTSASTSAPNHQFGSYPQPSQDLHSMTEQQQVSRDMPYYLP
uniref:uncharacterized protein LOC105349787 n=1 Tax=Fragaria vesca subsp. vesca TaxID=101020 RepID=UPI0005C92CA8|nr:PREDICTED: uncharacterized protein LOC105349787 [Fragaria vesca subsp. vesca]XP_011458739.1 PREDICTED: uncharacterized protein LOC105349787 [Fragaria vesca subsp. vesca]